MYTLRSMTIKFAEFIGLNRLVQTQGEHGDNTGSLGTQELRILRIYMALGLVGVLIYSTSFVLNGHISGFRIFGISMLLAGAALMLGGLLGFLFGIPRTLQNEQIAIPYVESSSSDAPPANGASINHRVNTNLEQISDWLTKILVGVGLTQLNEIPSVLNRYAVRMHMALGVGAGASTGGKAFILGLSIYFAICGFLFGYLWTRLYLAPAFSRADHQFASKNVEDTLQNVQSSLNTLAGAASNSAIDRQAMTLVLQQLDEGTPNASPTELGKAIEGASNLVRIQIYRQARDFRKKYLQDDREKMTLAIPIFEALAKSGEGDFFDAHAQLGYALKDQPNPDWQNAAKELSIAIRIRDEMERNGWNIYEFNRAICKIEQDNSFAEEKESDEDTKQTILSDLKVAAGQKRVKDYITDEPTIQAWMKLNHVSEDDLHKQA